MLYRVSRIGGKLLHRIACWIGSEGLQQGLVFGWREPGFSGYQTFCLFIAEETLITALGKYLAYDALKGEYLMEQGDETTTFQLLLTIPQVAKALNLGRTTIYELIWKENLPVQKFGRAIRVSKEDLQRWLEERRENH